MTTNAALVYRSYSYVAPATVSVAMAAANAPLPAPILSALGLLVSSDTTTAAVRTVNLALQPTVTAVGHSVLRPGAGLTKAGSPIASLVLDTAGSGYAAPPIVRFTPQAGDTTGHEAAALATLNLASVTFVAGGSTYTSPTVTLVGGLPPTGGVAATVTANVSGGGVITSFNVVSRGSGYVGVPTVVITDSTGSGAVGTAVLQVSGLTLTNPGKAYQAAPGVTLVDLFQWLFPTAAAQSSAVANLLTTGLQKAALVQVVADAPVIT